MSGIAIILTKESGYNLYARLESEIRSGDSLVPDPSRTTPGMELVSYPDLIYADLRAGYETRMELQLVHCPILA